MLCISDFTSPYFIDFIKHALEFGKVKFKLLEMTFKGKQNIFPHHQSLHCLVLTFRSNYEVYCHSISTRTIDLHVDAARIIFGYCASSCVNHVVPVLLIYINSFCNTNFRNTYKYLILVYSCTGSTARACRISATPSVHHGR